MIIPRENETFIYNSELASIKSKEFNTFNDFKNYLNTVLTDKNYQLLVYEYSNIRFKTYETIDDNLEKIILTIEKYFELQSINPLLSLHIFLFENNEVRVADILYTNNVIKNINKVITELSSDYFKHSDYSICTEFINFLSAQVSRSNLNSLNSKSIFDEFSDEQKQRYFELKKIIKLKYIESKIIEHNDEILEILKGLSELQLNY